MMSSLENSLMKPLSIEDSFNPHGLKVLVVDNDRDSLLHLAEMLTSCQYQVITCSLPPEALQLIKDNNNKFDIVITEVQFSPDINGVEFLEIIVRETGLPVVIVSADDTIDTITECILKGACTCIPKPAKKEVIQLIWQHVARRLLRHNLMKLIDQLEVNEPSSCTSVEEKQLCGSSDSDGVQTDDDQTKDQAKKHRMVWTQELHYKFVVAVKHLGIQNAVPKKVLELMNVPGLRRDSVASHLQKYRKNLQMLSTNMPHRFTEQSSIIQVSGDAYSQVFEDNNSFISTQLITGVQQCFAEQDSNGQVPIGANSQVMENDLFIRNSPITELQQHFTEDSSIQVPSGPNSQVMESNDLFIRNSPVTGLQQNFTVQDSNTEVPSGAYHPVIEKEDWEKDWFVGIPAITDTELQTLESELDNHFSFSMTQNTPCN